MNHRDDRDRLDPHLLSFLEALEKYAGMPAGVWRSPSDGRLSFVWEDPTIDRWALLTLDWAEDELTYSWTASHELWYTSDWKDNHQLPIGRIPPGLAKIFHHLRHRTFEVAES